MNKFTARHKTLRHVSVMWKLYPIWYTYRLYRDVTSLHTHYRYAYIYSALSITNVLYRTKVRKYADSGKYQK